jgi:hypothetical protein
MIHSVSDEDEESGLSNPLFDIVFRGDIVFGQNLAEVKLRLQRLFKADAAKVDGLFCGRPVPLKRNLEQAAAEKYRAVLQQAGIEVQLRPAVAAPQAQSSGADPQSSGTDPQGSGTYQKTATPAAVADPRPSPAPAVASGKLTLAPAGGELLKPSERLRPPAVSVDISGISLRPEGGNLLDSEEIPHPVAAVVQVPDFGVAEPGANLVGDDERQGLPLLEIDVSDWDLAEVGSDLLSEGERQHVEAVQVDTSNLELAPAVSDLGQLKPRVDVVIPDTSALALVPDR